MIECQLEAQNCATIDVEGFQEGFGKSIEQNQNGFIGLDYYKK